MYPLRFLAEFLKDCLSQEVQTICSSYLAGAKAGVKKDRAILAWLQEAVIGDSPSTPTFSSQSGYPPSLHHHHHQKMP